MIKVLSLSTQESPTLVDYSLKKEILKVNLKHNYCFRFIKMLFIFVFVFFYFSKKSLTHLLKSFPKKISPLMNDILTQVWSCLVQSSEVYLKAVVNSDSTLSNSNDQNGKFNSSLDPEDEKTSLENLVYQLFDFILILKEKNRYKQTIKKAVDELTYYAILYMQITDDRVSY